MLLPRRGMGGELASGGDEAARLVIAGSDGYILIVRQRRLAMGRIITSICAAIVLAGAAQAATFEPLVTPTLLAGEAAGARPIMLDIRESGYDAGHVPGAVQAAYADFRGGKANPGAVPDLAALERTFEGLGLQTDRPIVILPEGKTDSDFGAAARVYWTLKSTGFTDLSILNGGTQAWTAAGLPLETTATTPQPTDLDLTFSDEWLASTETVSDVVAGNRDAVLVDARPDPFYAGRDMHDSAARPGTLPGAESYPHSTFFTPGTPTVAPVIDTAALKQALGVEDDTEVVAFCNTGHWAATEWFALSELAGLDNVKLYPGSMVEYSQSGLPMENVPGLLGNLTRQIFGN